MAKDDEPKTVAKKKCFVISQLGNPGTETRQKADDFLKYIVEQCRAMGVYDVNRADKISEPGRITAQIMRAIVEADLVIADVTGENPNVYYEMALCHGIGKPIIVCAEDGTTLPFDTRDNRTVFYGLHSRRAEAAREELAEQITAISKDGFRPDNPIADAGAIIELRMAGETGLAEVLVRLDEMSSRLGGVENRLRASSARGAFGKTLLNAGLQGNNGSDISTNVVKVPAFDALFGALATAAMEEKAKELRIRAKEAPADETRNQSSAATKDDGAKK